MPNLPFLQFHLRQHRLYWHTTFGEIRIQEQRYRQGGKQVRPFCQSAGVKCQGYSLRLQRACVDFGADESLEKSAQKLKEHYGIEVPVSAIRVMTLNHGAAMVEIRDWEKESELSEGGTGTVIGQMDGCFVPIVTIKPLQNNESPRDGRKRRELSWHEARLALGRDTNKVRPHYSATMGSVEEATELLIDCLIKAGAGKSTKLHCMGDGAPWIVNRTKEKLEGKATFLLDFYHLSEYLACAADVIAGEQKRSWLKQQQERLKENRVGEVMDELLAHCESHDLTICRRKHAPNEKEECPADRCKRYIESRLDYLDYKSAIEADLPIGTGEVEAGHRSVIQPRAKRSGAWWLIDNVQKILALRTNRANQEWEPYWAQLRQQAA